MDAPTCDELGEAHQVNEAELQEAVLSGGTVRCLRCGKAVSPPVAERDLRIGGDEGARVLP